jgi:hypothetical protein
MFRRSVGQQLAVVRDKLKQLESLSYSEVESLPRVLTEEITIEGKRATVSIWHDALDQGAHLIAVQAYTPWLLGIGRMVAEGFVINADSTRRSLTQAEWAEFS